MYLAAARFVELSKLGFRLEDHLEGRLIVRALATIVAKLITRVVAPPQVPDQGHSILIEAVTIDQELLGLV